MAPQGKRPRLGALPKSDPLEAILTTPVSKEGPSKLRRVRSKKPDNGVGHPKASPKPCTRRSLNTTLDPGLLELFEPKSRTRSASKPKSKPLSEKLRVESPGLSELLEMSGRKVKTPRTVDEVFEKYMEQDPYASIWSFIPQERAPSPDRPLTFFSPTKERPRTLPCRRINRVEAIDGKESGGNGTVNGIPPARKDVDTAVLTPLFGKQLDAAAYSPCGSAGKNLSRVNGSAWLCLSDTNGSSYSSTPSSSTPSEDPFKTPSADGCRQPSSTVVPLSGVKTLFTEKSSAPDSPVNTFSRTDSFEALRTESPAYHHSIPEHIKKTILLGVTCFVDVKYNKEDRAKYVQQECLALGAKVEKNFTKKVTHVVFKGGKMSTYIKAKENDIPLVSLLWLEACKVVGNMVDPALYPPTENEKYQKEMPIEEDKRRQRFLQRSRAFLDRINGILPARPTRTRSGRKLVGPVSVTDVKKKAKKACTVKKELADPDVKAKVPKKLNFNQAPPSHEKKPDSGDSDYVSESDSEENGQPKRRKSAPADIGGDGPTVLNGQKKLTHYFNKKPKVKKPEQQPKYRSPDRTPQKQDNDLLKVLTGGFTTQDKKKRKLFDPNQSLMSQPLLPVELTPIELSPYVKASPQSKRSGSRCRSTSSKKPPSRSTSSKADRRVKEAKRPVNARKSLVPLMEQQEEEEDALSVSTSRNSLVCFDLTRKGKTVAPKCQPRIAFTCLPKEDIGKYKEIISRLGTFAVDPNVTKTTTHLVTSTPVKRTVNLLKAIARGCWILDVEWLINSEQSGKWMSEEPFEQKSFSEAVTASRLEKQAFGKDYSMDLFSDCGPIFVDSHVQPPRQDLVSLLKTCCGKVVSVSTNAEIIVSKRPLTDHNSQIAVVSPLWILDSITHNKRMDLDKYRI